MIIVQVAGHLGADAETRVTPDGQKVSSLRVATNVRRSGRDETVWWRVSLWGDRWEKMLQYLTKGAGVIVIGEMQKPEIFQNRDGQSQVSLDIRADIVKFSPFGRTDRTERSERSSPRAPSETTTGMSQSPQFEDISDEDLPF